MSVRSLILRSGGELKPNIKRKRGAFRETLFLSKICDHHKMDPEAILLG
jgi:hypothetical protein